MNLIILRDPWRPHPLAWIHRVEARSIATELKRLGHAVTLLPFRENQLSDLPRGQLLLRLSDPVMLLASQALSTATRPFTGPAAAVMENCYDKYCASRLAAAHGIECPATVLARDPGAVPFPVVLKPREGSDSIGIKLWQTGPIPPRWRTEAHIAQEQIRGLELTVGMVRGRMGLPLRILLPEGRPYTFLRKYLLTPDREVLTDGALLERICETARAIACSFRIDWAARIDFLYDPLRKRLCFLECDVAPLVGPASAFAHSLTAAGITRREQLRLLIDPDAA